MLTKKNEIWHDSLCLDYSGTGKAQLWPCHKLGGNQKWIHEKVRHFSGCLFSQFISFSLVCARSIIAKDGAA